MTRYTFSVTEELASSLRRLLCRDSREYGALVICGRSRHIDPWSGELEERFLGREVVEVPESAFLERTETGMVWSTAPFYHALKRIEPKGYAIAAVHSHPTGALAFSPKDDVADRELFQIAFDRLDSDRPHVSMIMNPDGEIAIRVYEDDLKPQLVDLVRVIGAQWHFVSPRPGATVAKEFDRQVRAFGPAVTQTLASLRVGIVGCGGTGSAVAVLLARLGIGRIVLIDPDRVDETNLNRLHLSSRTDANLARAKVDVLGEALAGIGLQTQIVRVQGYAYDHGAKGVLCSCDIVFGCTDDHLGRDLLNRLAYFYLIPVIDLGLLIDPRADGGYDVFDGRVTVVQPGYPCQHCRGLIQGEQLFSEGLRRHDPDLYRERRRAGYVAGAPDPSPAVVTFTTEVATMATNEFLQRLTGFRGSGGAVAERVRRFDEVKVADTLPGGIRRPDCKLCGRRVYDARGDMTPFLDQA